MQILVSPIRHYDARKQQLPPHRHTSLKQFDADSNRYFPQHNIICSDRAFDFT